MTTRHHPRVTHESAAEKREEVKQDVAADKRQESQVNEPDVLPAGHPRPTDLVAPAAVEAMAGADFSNQLAKTDEDAAQMSAFAKNAGLQRGLLSGAVEEITSAARAVGIKGARVTVTRKHDWVRMEGRGEQAWRCRRDCGATTTNPADLGLVTCTAA